MHQLLKRVQKFKSFNISMLGKFTSSLEPVTIVGGGFAGLSLAFRLATLDKKVVLHERSERFGGLICTDQLSRGKSEAAANSLLVNAAVKDFCDELELPLLPLAKDAKSRFILRSGKLCRFPLTFPETLQTIWYGTTTISLEEELTLKEWATKFVGRAALDYLVDPGVSGIFASPPAALSAKLVSPALLIPKGQSLAGKILRGLWAKQRPQFRPYMAIPQGGMQTLIEALVGKLQAHPNVTLHLNSHLEDLTTDENVALCVPAYQAAKLLAPICSTSAETLNAIEYAPLVSATMVGPKSCFASVPKGTGVLMPSCENRRVLGILFCSSSFPSLAADQDTVILRIFMGGMRNPEVLQESKEELIDRASYELRELFGFQQSEGVEWQIYPWKRAIPVYSSLLENAWNRIPWVKRPGNVLFTNYTGQVSLRGMIERLNSDLFL
jgi:oxygen-dependent protoporphyrinogen oxidase